MSRGRSRIVTMGFPDRGEENLMRQTSKCKNFQPNMFNKTKCQNCFRTREAHDLGDDDGSNKPKKALQYGYLFVAPGIDFDAPMARTRKWQRRCFILYENGELCYSLDFDPNAIPQGVVNMYECTKVFGSDELTGHQFSMGIATPDETTYIRAESREEKDRWYETLVEYPEINKENAKQKKKKRGIFPMIGQKDSENSQKIEEQAEAKPDLPSGDDDPLSDDLLLESRDEVGPVENTTARDTTDIHTATSKAARKEKSNLRRSHSALEQRPDKYEKKMPVRRTPSAQAAMTSSTSETMSPRIGRRPTMAVGEGQEDSAMSGKGDASRRPSDGSGYKYSSSSSIRSRQSESGLVDLERELRNKDDVFRSHKESLPAQAGGAETSLHRNNNNVYKDVSPRLSPTQHPTTSSSSRKSSLGDANTTETDSPQSTTDSSQTKKAQPSKTDTTNAQNMLSQEELQRMDVPKRGRMRINKSLIEGETQSPSKRTIERRRHAQDRRNRHTLDGSTVPFPISERKDRTEGGPRLKRSNSDPNLADTEEVKRKEIAETFPGLLHLKNGWLMMQDPGQEDWNKYWFVLRDNKLSYFKDSSDENPSNLAGAVDLAVCQEAAETTASRNYGFQVKMADDSAHKLGAMTSGIRTNWIQAINKAIATARKEASPVAEVVAPLKEPKDVVPVVDSAPVLSEPSPLQEQTSSVAPDVIPTPLPRQNSLDPARSSLSIDLTSRHRKNSMDSRRSESASPTEKDPPVFHERQGSIRSKERRSRRSSRTTEESSQKLTTATKLSSSSVNDRSSSTSSEAFETPPNTPTPIELRIEEPVRRTSTSSTRSEKVEEQLQVHKIEADSLKPQTDQQDMDVMALDSLQQRTSLGGMYNKQSALDNENEQKALVSQLETVVKKLSQVELQNQTLHMEVKQARNASELLKHEKEDLHDKLQNTNSVLDKRARECETLQSRFEKLVSDYQESEKEVSKARTSLKAEREKTLPMIERLNEQIDVLEGEKGEIKERAKKYESELVAHKKEIRLLEKNQEESEKVLHKLLKKRDELKQRLDAKSDEGSSSTKELLEVNRQLQARLQELEQQLALKENVDSQRVPLDIEQDAEELADLRMELSERDEQIEQLTEQLEAEFGAKSDLQSKYDSLVAESAQIVLEGQGDTRPTDATYAELEKKLMSTVANLENLKTQLTYETAQRKQTEDKLSQEMSEKGRLAEDFKELERRLQNALEEGQDVSQAQEDTRNLMQLLQVKNKEVEKMQTEIKRIEVDRVSLMQQTGDVTAEIEEVKRQLKDSEEAKNTLEGDMECVLQSKLDLEEAAKQTATELVTVKSEMELLRKTSQDASSSAEEVSRREAERQEAAQKEVQLLQAKVDKVQEMYTEDMFKKEKLLAEEKEKLAEMERKFASLQGKLTNKEEELAQKEKESGEKVLEVTKQLEQLSQKVEREEKDLKRLRTELKTSQDNYDALELKHMQTTEESKQQQKSQQEQLELMGRRIQDLTNKLGTAERKIADAPASAAKTTDTSDCSDSPSTDGVDEGTSQIKVLESRLAEMETKLRKVTHRLVDVTTRELEKRKAYQAKCVTENKLKDQVRGLQREVLALRQQMEKEQQSDELVQTQQRLHQEALEKLQETHRKELEALTKEHAREKEQEDEAVTTTISALKRAFEADVEKERKMSQESYPKDVETIMKRHREVVTQMNRDWRILSQKFSEQCRENTMLSKALRAMQRSQKEAHEKLQQAQVENRQRVDRLGERLARMEEDEDEEEEDEEDDDEEDDEDIDEEELRKLKMHLRLRELELEFAREEIDSLRQTQLGGGEKGAPGGASRDEKEGAGDKTHHGSLIPGVETASDAATRPKTRRSLSDLTQKFYKSKKGEKK